MNENEQVPFGNPQLAETLQEGCHVTVNFCGGLAGFASGVVTSPRTPRGDSFEFQAEHDIHSVGVVHKAGSIVSAHFSELVRAKAPGSPNSALIIVDVLNDFVEGGALAVKDGNAVIPVINRIQNKFDLRVALQEAHRPDHCSFYVNHPDKKMGDVVVVNGLEQVLWPVHCVFDEIGSHFAPGLDMTHVDEVVKKGIDSHTDSYSGFCDNGGRNDTGLEAYLRTKGITRVFVAGLATDYCDKATAIDAVKRGFETYLVEDACRGVDFHPGDVARAIQEMKDAGVIVIQSHEVDAILAA